MRLARQASVVLSRIYEENSYRRSTENGCPITILSEFWSARQKGKSGRGISSAIAAKDHDINARRVG